MGDKWVLQELMNSFTLVQISSVTCTLILPHLKRKQIQPLFFFFFFLHCGFLRQHPEELLNSVLSHCFVFKVTGSRGNPFSRSFTRNDSNSQSFSSLLSVQHKINFPQMLSLRNKSDRFWLLLIICAAVQYQSAH